MSDNICDDCCDTPAEMKNEQKKELRDCLLAFLVICFVVVLMKIFFFNSQSISGFNSILVAVFYVTIVFVVFYGWGANRYFRGRIHKCQRLCKTTSREWEKIKIEAQNNAPEHWEIRKAENRDKLEKVFGDLAECEKLNLTLHDNVIAEALRLFNASKTAEIYKIAYKQTAEKICDEIPELRSDLKKILEEMRSELLKERV